jgi:hypothetical protein
LPFLSESRRQSVHLLLEQFTDAMREVLHHTKPGAMPNLDKRRPWSDLALPTPQAKAVEQQPKVKPIAMAPSAKKRSPEA